MRLQYGTHAILNKRKQPSIDKELLSQKISGSIFLLSNGHISILMAPTTLLRFPSKSTFVRCVNIKGRVRTTRLSIVPLKKRSQNLTYLLDKVKKMIRLRSNSPYWERRKPNRKRCAVIWYIVCNYLGPLRVTQKREEEDDHTESPAKPTTEEDLVC